VEREEKVWYGNLPTRSPEKHELRLRMKLNKVLTGISSIGIVDRDHSPFRNHQKPQKPNLLSHQDLKSDEPNVARPLSFHQPIAGSHPPHPAQPDPTRLKSRFARY
jgi:hypothetical protein